MRGLMLRLPSLFQARLKSQLKSLASKKDLENVDDKKSDEIG